MKSHFAIQFLPDPISIREPASKLSVDNKFNDVSILKNTAHNDINDKNLDNDRFVQVNSMPAVGEYLTAIYFVDQASSNSVDEPTLLRLDLDEKIKLDEQNSIIFNSTLTSPKGRIVTPTKSYGDSLSKINRKGGNLSTVFNNQDNKFDENNSRNSDFVTNKKDPSSDNEITNETHVDDALGESTILRFNQTIQIYLKVSTGNDVYNLSKNDRIQITYTTLVKILIKAVSHYNKR